MLALLDANPPPEDDVSAYLLSEPRILRDVCQSMRRDDNGRRCPQCSVRTFCESQARQAGKLGAVDSIAVPADGADPTPRLAHQLPAGRSAAVP